MERAPIYKSFAFFDFRVTKIIFTVRFIYVVYITGEMPERYQVGITIDSLLIVVADHQRSFSARYELEDTRRGNRYYLILCPSGSDEVIETQLIKIVSKEPISMNTQVGEICIYDALARALAQYFDVPAPLDPDEFERTNDGLGGRLLEAFHARLTPRPLSDQHRSPMDLGQEI